MVALTQPFDASQVDPSQQIPSLPIGRHPVVIVGSDGKATKAGDGGYIQFDLQILDGPAKGVKGAYRLNLYNSNQDTVRIAYQQLSAVCHVCGVYMLQDTQQLHNIPFIIDVDFQKGDEARQKGYTQVTRVYDRNMNEPGKQGQAPAAAQPAPAQAAPTAAAAWPNQPAPPQTQQQPAGAPPGNWAGGNGAGTPPGQPAAAWTPPTQQQPVQAAPAWNNQAPPQQQQPTQQMAAPGQPGGMPWTPRS